MSTLYSESWAFRDVLFFSRFESETHPGASTHKFGQTTADFCVVLCCVVDEKNEAFDWVLSLYADCPGLSPAAATPTISRSAAEPAGHTAPVSITNGTRQALSLGAG